MIHHVDLKQNELILLLRKGKLVMAGHQQYKIFGTLHCASGKRMKKINRVFFESEQDAEQQGFRPCAHCLSKKYREWKLRKKQVESGGL